MDSIESKTRKTSARFQSSRKKALPLKYNLIKSSIMNPSVRRFCAIYLDEYVEREYRPVLIPWNPHVRGLVDAADFYFNTDQDSIRDYEGGRENVKAHGVNNSPTVAFDVSQSHTFLNLMRPLQPDLPHPEDPKQFYRLCSSRLPGFSCEKKYFAIFLRLAFNPPTNENVFLQFILAVL